MVKIWNISIIVEKFYWNGLDNYCRHYTDIAQVKNLNTLLIPVAFSKWSKIIPTSERFIQELNKIIYVKMLS